MTRSRFRSVFAPFALTAVLAVVVVIGRLTWEARTALRNGDARKGEGAASEAVAHYLDAARAHYPGNPYAGEALDRLLGMAEASPGGEAVNEHVARRALEAFRAAVLATRSVYVPRAADLENVNARLAAMYARSETRGRPGVAVNAVELSRRQQWHLEKLTPLPGPSLLWSVVALLGLAIWLSAVAAFITRALTPNMKIVRGPALGAGLAFVCGLTLFLLGLAQ